MPNKNNGKNTCQTVQWYKCNFCELRHNKNSFENKLSTNIRSEEYRYSNTVSPSHLKDCNSVTSHLMCNTASTSCSVGSIASTSHTDMSLCPLASFSNRRQMSCFTVPDDLHPPRDSNSLTEPNTISLPCEATAAASSTNTKFIRLPSKQMEASHKPWVSPRSDVRWISRIHCLRRLLARSIMTSVLLLCLSNPIVVQAKIRSRAGDPNDPVGNIRHVLPELELGNNSITDVHYNLGTTAFLPCRFPSFPRHHENRVSWVRRDDWHILTAGLYTYANDDRFVVLHRDGTNEWTLQIKFVTTQDNGTYECQVHSGSGFMSQFVNLYIVTPRAVILEPRELTVKNGEEFSLTCVIQQSLQPPVFVMWLHAGVPVNYAPDRPRLTVQLEQKGAQTRSILTVRDAKYTDSGNYTCTSPNAIVSWVLVYVTEGDTVAAVQRRHPDNTGGGKVKTSKSEVAKTATRTPPVVLSEAPLKGGSSSGRPSAASAKGDVVLCALAVVLLHTFFLQHLNAIYTSNIIKDVYRELYGRFNSVKNSHNSKCSVYYTSEEERTIDALANINMEPNTAPEHR